MLIFSFIKSPRLLIKFFAFIFAAISSLPSVAVTSMVIPGTTNTLGNTTIGQYLLSVSHNPAACGQVIAPQKQFRMGFLSSIGGSFEIGQVDNFENEINDLVDILDESNVTLDAAQGLLTRFNGVLQNLDQYGYLKSEFDVAVPGLPMAYHRENWKGSVCAEGSLSAAFKASVLYGELLLTTRNVNNSVEVDFSTSSSLLIKSAELTQFGFDYARPIYQREQQSLPGKLLLGTRVNFYSMQLSRQVMLFENFEDDDVGDVIRDEYDANQHTDTNLGLDLGASWVAEKYQLGFTLANINEPEFSYGDFSLNCNQLTASSQNNCLAALNFVNQGDIALQETHVMHAISTVDATYWLMSRWAVAGSYDLADYNDPLGDELQWLTVSTAYMPVSRWIPAWRVGYRKNLVGEKLASVNFGTTLFGVFNMDLLYGLDSAVIDGDEVPRTAGLYFGFEQRI